MPRHVGQRVRRHALADLDVGRPPVLKWSCLGTVSPDRRPPCPTLVVSSSVRLVLLGSISTPGLGLVVLGARSGRRTVSLCSPEPGGGCLTTLGDRIARERDSRGPDIAVRCDVVRREPVWAGRRRDSGAMSQGGRSGEGRSHGLVVSPDGGAWAAPPAEGGRGLSGEHHAVHDRLRPGRGSSGRHHGPR